MTGALCPFCGAPSVFRLEAPSPDDVGGPCHKLYQCDPCAVAFVHPVPPSNGDSGLYAESYYSRFGKILEWASRRLLISKRKRIEAFARKGKILDFGCGKGEFLREMQRAGWDVRGVESSDSARKILPPPLGRLVFKELSALSSERFEVITLWHVLEHLPNPKRTLAEIIPLLKKDGLLFAAVPNLASWEAGFGGADWFHLDLPRHLVHFRPEGLAKILNGLGFDVQRVNHFSWAYNVFGLYQTWLNRISGSRNALYNKFKRRQNVGWGSVAGSLILTPVFLAGAFPACLALGMRGKAGTMEVYARQATQT